MLTVNDLKELATKDEKDWVLVICGDANGTHYVTWGRWPEDKCHASAFSEDISAWIDSGGCASMTPANKPAEVYESFRLDAAKNKARVEELEKVLHQLDAVLHFETGFQPGDFASLGISGSDQIAQAFADAHWCLHHATTLSVSLEQPHLVPVSPALSATAATPRQ